MLRLVAILVSAAVHMALALYFLSSPGGAAFEQGSGQDLMVVEQGTSDEGIAKLGEDVASVEPVEAPPVQTAAPPPPPQEAKPVEDHIITSDNGPEQETDVQDKPQQIQQQQAPSEVATPPEETVIEEHESSGLQEIGGNTNARQAYLGEISKRIQKCKINPRSEVSGTTVVSFTLDPSGSIVSGEVSTSSGSKVLDDAALASVQKCAFPAMPKDIQNGAMQVSQAFKFTVR